MLKLKREREREIRRNPSFYIWNLVEIFRKNLTWFFLVSYLDYFRLTHVKASNTLMQRVRGKKKKREKTQIKLST